MRAAGERIRRDGLNRRKERAPRPMAAMQDVRMSLSCACAGRCRSPESWLGALLGRIDDGATVTSFVDREQTFALENLADLFECGSDVASRKSNLPQARDVAELLGTRLQQRNGAREAVRDGVDAVRAARWSWWRGSARARWANRNRSRSG